MKIRVRIDDVEVEIDRPNFADYNRTEGKQSAWRSNMMNDTILPLLTEATNKAKELYKLK